MPRLCFKRRDIIERHRSWLTVHDLAGSTPCSLHVFHLLQIVVLSMAFLRVAPIPISICLLEIGFLPALQGNYAAILPHSDRAHCRGFAPRPKPGGDWQ